jgi:acyl-CoA synthetase (AMP-forming)/AMP-acid ligase II
MSVIKQRFATAASRLAPLQRLGEERLRSGYSVADQWEELVDHQGEAACLVQVADGILPARQLSFNEAEALANELAHAISTLTLRTGDAVALMFDNRVEFVALWIGLSKLGLVSAWINNAIKGGPLVHSISAAKSKLLVFGVEHAEAVESVSQELGQAGILLLSMSGGVSFCKCLDDLLPRSPSHRPSRDARAMVKYTDTMCYIYTSGTTGLPKASLISHQKFCSTGLSARAMLTPTDIVYGSGMPLYHSSAGMVGISYMMGVGCCYIIRRRFSASAWIGDVKQHKVTVVQYIGELARYLLTVTGATRRW